MREQTGKLRPQGSVEIVVYVGRLADHMLNVGHLFVPRTEYEEFLDVLRRGENQDVRLLIDSDVN